jgi:hypothetical protein
MAASTVPAKYDFSLILSYSLSYPPLQPVLLHEPE